MTNTISYSVRSKFGQLNKVKKDSGNFRAFYLDVLYLLKSTADTYGLNMTQVISLYMTCVDDDKFVHSKDGVKFRINNVPKDLINFIATSSLNKKQTHSSILRLLLSYGENDMTIMGNMIIAKTRIDRLLSGVDNLSIDTSIKVDNSIKTITPSDIREIKPLLTKAKSSKKTKSKSALSKALEDFKKDEELLTKEIEEQAKVTAKIKEEAKTIQSNDLLSDFL